MTALLCLADVLAQTDSTSARRVRYTPLPVISYSPETRWAFGAFLAASFNMSTDSLTTSSYAQTYFLYTLNKQYDWGSRIRYYGARNKRILEGSMGLTYFPEYYYGIATEKPKPNETLIAYNRLSAEFRHYWYLRQFLYAGVTTRYNRIYRVHYQPGESFDLDKPIGYDGYQVWGFAPALTYESRNSQTYPEKGLFIELRPTFYPKLLANSWAFYNIRLDARAYVPLRCLHKKDVLAFHWLVNLNQGSLPFKEMADVGGSNIMRGYYTGYYRYPNLYAAQAEYRATVWRFIGFATWVGAAFTPKKMFSVGDSSIKPTAGFGLRIQLNPADRVNLRIDQGYGTNGQQGLYFDIAEAF